jgi:hypothetical protein
MTEMGQSLHMNGGLTSAVHPNTDIDERPYPNVKRANFRHQSTSSKSPGSNEGGVIRRCRVCEDRQKADMPNACQGTC